MLISDNGCGGRGLRRENGAEKARKRNSSELWGFYWAEKW